RGGPRLERVVEADPVVVLHGAQALLPPPVGLVQVRVLAKDLLGARVQAEVARRAAQRVVELLVVLLTLLPARGHRRHRTAHPVLGHDLGQRGAEALRAQQYDHRRSARSQRLGAPRRPAAPPPPGAPHLPPPPPLLPPRAPPSPPP